MSNPNFVSDLVAMAKAYEELPTVKAELDAERTKLVEALNNIQRLELRLIDQANELADARSATRKAEVERDHAEEMFLTTDDKLNAFMRLAQSFQPTVAQPEPKVEPEPVKVEYEATVLPPQEVNPVEPKAEPYEAPPVNWAQPQAEGVSVAVDPLPSPTISTEQSDIGSTHTTSAPTVEESSVSKEAPHPVDPTVNSTAGDGHSQETATPIPSAQPPADATSTDTSFNEDDVGYHNEPKIDTSPNGWQAWDSWCTRMNRRYGGGSWPARPATA